MKDITVVAAASNEQFLNYCRQNNLKPGMNVVSAFGEGIRGMTFPPSKVVYLPDWEQRRGADEVRAYLDMCFAMDRLNKEPTIKGVQQ